MLNTAPPLILHHDYAASKQKIWTALTELDQLREWFFKEIPEFRAEQGFTVAFDIKAPSRTFRHQWTLTEVEPPHRITFRWSYEDIDGLGYVTFELAEIEENKTRCTIINTTVDSFPQEYPEFKRESGIAGWTYFLKDRLKSHLEKTP